MEISEKVVYLDNAATTACAPEVLAVMTEALSGACGNPSSHYSVGYEAKEFVDTGRAQVAKAINAAPAEIFFTGCGSEADNWAVKGTAFTKARRPVENAMRGYKEINYRAMKLLPRGGYLATASCSHFATEELFIKMLRAAAKDAHRQLRQIEVKQQAPDHPILWGVPETNYLKFFLFQVI